MVKKKFYFFGSLSSKLSNCSIPDFVLSIESCALQKFIINNPPETKVKHCENVKTFLSLRKDAGKNSETLLLLIRGSG